jgi:hypothetical protein
MTTNYRPPLAKADGYPTDNLIRSLDDRSLLRHMGVPPKYWQEVVARGAEKMPPGVEDWIADLPSIYRPLPDAPDRGRFGEGLIFYGPTRSGKTITAVSLLLRLVRMGIHNNDPGGLNRWDGWCMGRFEDWQESSATFRQAAQGGEREDRADQLRDAMMARGEMTRRGDFLVIDDISRERGTEFNTGELTRILRQRGDWGYPTIITTNHDAGDWEEAYDSEALLGYLGDMFLHVPFGGAS